MNIQRRHIGLAIPLIIFVVLVSLITFTDIFHKKYYIKCCLFDKSNISGLVQDHHSGTGGTGILVNDVQYKLNPDIIQNKYRFTEVVAVGDSIHKRSFSDTLLLFKANSNKVYFIKLKFCCKELE